MTATPRILTRRNVSAIAKLDFAGLSHAQRLEAIAKVLGYANAGALMSALKAAEVPAPSQTPPEGPFRVIAAFGEAMVNAIEWENPIIDKNGEMLFGDLVSRDFATRAEVEAYAQGIADYDGWSEGNIVLSEDDEPDHPYLKALDAGAVSDFPQWYAQQIDEED